MAEQVICNLGDIITDYVKHHCNELLEEAYAHGHADAESKMQEAIDRAYQKGVNDAKTADVVSYETCMHEDQEEYEEPCVKCKHRFMSQWKPKDVKRRIQEDIDSLMLLTGMSIEEIADKLKEMRE